jgi:hypothetical protein
MIVEFIMISASCKKVMEKRKRCEKKKIENKRIFIGDFGTPTVFFHIGIIVCEIW